MLRGLRLKGLLELSVEVLGFRGFRVQVAIDYAQGSGA